MIKTNAMRMLTAEKIPFEVLEYEVDENDLSGIHIAEQLQFPPEKMFKTLVVIFIVFLHTKSMLQWE